MKIVTSCVLGASEHLERVPLIVDRLTLEKRRWRAMATDGVEFGFDLKIPLNDGDLFYADDHNLYSIQQSAEPVLEIALIARPAPVARLGWTIGNLHFPIEVTENEIRVPDDSALRRLFEREKISFVACERVFKPFGKTHAHS
jgi:urease accessory protein